MHDADIIEQIANATALDALATVVYRGPIAGPNSHTVHVYDCPHPADPDRRHQRGVLYIVTDPTDEPGCPATVKGGEAIPAVPANRPLGVSTVSVMEALRMAAIRTGAST